MFIPKIRISVPKTSDSLTVTDITGTSPADATGYDLADYLPQDNVSWGNKQSFVQALGSSEVTTLSLNYTTAAGTFDYTMADGIYLLTQYFCVETDAAAYTIDADLKVLTKTDATPWIDPLGLFEGVYGLVISDSVPTIEDVAPITAITNSTVTLSAALTGATTDAPVWVVYKVQKYFMVVNDAHADLVSDIGDMALSSLRNGQGCDNSKALALWRRIMLKFSAETNMACGNYTKAHNAIVLLTQSSESNPNCSTCG